MKQKNLFKDIFFLTIRAVLPQYCTMLADFQNIVRSVWTTNRYQIRMYGTWTHVIFCQIPTFARSDFFYNQWQNSAPPHFTCYIHRFHPQKSSAFYPCQHPHVRRSACLHFTMALATGPSRRNPKKNSYRSVSYNSPTYQIWFRLPIPKLNPKTYPNPNLKSNKNVCSTKQHRNNFQHRVISKSYFRWAGGGYTKGPPPEGGIKLLQK